LHQRLLRDAAATAAAAAGTYSNISAVARRHGSGHSSWDPCRRRPSACRSSSGTSSGLAFNISAIGETIRNANYAKPMSSTLTWM